MRVFIAGFDGYIGWALSQHLASLGHVVSGCDNGSRRSWVTEVGGSSVIPIGTIKERITGFKKKFGYCNFGLYSTTNYESIREGLLENKPDAIIHLAEMPSAPYSMIDARHSVFTQENNVSGTLNILYAMKEVCPEASLTKLGSLGEYGYSDLDIPEGFFEVEYKGRKSTIPFPKSPGSIYHLSKVHDTYNITFACDVWGLRSTDIMQGVVYGSSIPEMGLERWSKTRLDIDACFGTALNRFCAQAALGAPITLYGKGRQRRGFLQLCDSIQCLTLSIENPPDLGEYRVFNQFEDVYCIEDLADTVVLAAKKIGIEASISHIKNPRKEEEDHYYNPEHKKLLDLGYKPSHNMEECLIHIMQDMLSNKGLLEKNKDVLLPSIQWT